MAVKFDRSERTILVYCTDCPPFAEAFGIAAEGDAHAAAVAHAERTHGADSRPGRDTRIQATRHKSKVGLMSHN